MRFDQSAIREIHARTDIAAFIGSYVALRKRGNDLVGLCPFHSEKTPSFHVHPDRGFFKCFGCGAGGDAIAFISKLENLTFTDAVRFLAQRAGVELEPETPQSARRRSEREAIYEANAIATAFFESCLRSGAPAAREYCDRRGLTPEVIARFHLGYAPDSWSALADELRRNGVDPEIAAAGGLLKRGERGFYDFYRDRLMVPTYSTTGEVIAFGGRALGDAEPKYLNTSTNPAYTKGRHLFALNLARRAAAQDRTLIVVEGYLDCIALHQAGFENAVAALGTAFTAEQANELRKYADGIFLCFDGDPAGTAAAGKAIETAASAMESAGSKVRIVALPAGEDPDGFVRAKGATAFGVLLQHAKPAIEYRLENEIARLATGFEAPGAIAAEGEQIIRRMTPRTEWDRWRVWLAQRLQVAPDDLRNSRFLSNAANFAPRSGVPARNASRHASVTPVPVTFEREVLGLVVDQPALLREYRVRIPADAFRAEPYRSIYARLAQHAETLENGTDVFALFADDNETVGLLAGLVKRDRSSTVRYSDDEERRVYLDRVVERLRFDEERKRYGELSRKIDDLAQSGQNISPELRDEFGALAAKLKK